MDGPITAHHRLACLHQTRLSCGSRPISRWQISTVQQALAFFPSEAYLELTAMSVRALLYGTDPLQIVSLFSMRSLVWAENLLYSLSVHF